MRFALIAGEASGDLLGAALIPALRARFPGAQFYGVTGPRMREAGCESIATIDRLSVMGISEVLPKLAGILRLRRQLVKRFRRDRPDCVIGIDAPDFNLGLERRLRESGLKSVHLVSPTVWAWRQGRVVGIARSVDLILCLFPFEPKFYAGHGLRAEYIGHTLAEELAHPVERDAARALIQAPIPGQCVAILPGSRSGELARLAVPFAKTAAWIAKEIGVGEVSFVTPIAKPSLRPIMERAIARYAPGVRWKLVEGHSREAMLAADAVLVASGTATLECLLLNRPMVVAYRLSAFTAWLLGTMGMLKIKKVSLPNLLCDEPIVPELLQSAVTVKQMGPPLLELLTNGAARNLQLRQFDKVRHELKRDAAQLAASAIASLVKQP